MEQPSSGPNWRAWQGSGVVQSEAEGHPGAECTDFTFSPFPLFAFSPLSPHCHPSRSSTVDPSGLIAASSCQGASLFFLFNLLRSIAVYCDPQEVTAGVQIA